MANLQKPKDCTCGLTNGNHSKWCPAYERLLRKQVRKLKEEADAGYPQEWADKDEYGRWVAGVGPKPSFVEDGDG